MGDFNEFVIDFNWDCFCSPVTVKREDWGAEANDGVAVA
jgi:hypothetical protein